MGSNGYNCQYGNEGKACAVLGIWPPQLWVKPGSQADRILQAAAPEPGPWTMPETLPKIPRPPTKK